LLFQILEILNSVKLNLTHQHFCSSEVATKLEFFIFGFVV
jgi:hypothetical protein